MATVGAQARTAMAAASPPAGGNDTVSPAVATSPPRRAARRPGWYTVFVALAAAAFLVADYFTGLNIVAATARFAWNAAAVAANSVTRAAGGLIGLIAKGVGWRRLSRVGSSVAGIGLSYSGAVVLSEGNLRRAQGWSGKLKASAAAVRRMWLALHLVWKLAIVGVLIASQVYLHVLLIVFPVAFLVPVLRRVWVRCADLVLGGWYWKTFGRRHRQMVAALRSTPGIRHAIGAARLARIRYLCAWRVWRYDPRYHSGGGRRSMSLAEPLRLLRRGALDAYVGRPLLCGPRHRSAPCPDAEDVFAPGARTQ